MLNVVEVGRFIDRIKVIKNRQKKIRLYTYIYNRYMNFSLNNRAGYIYEKLKGLLADIIEGAI